MTAFCKYLLLGNKSWRYDDAKLDLYGISCWIYKNREAIVSAVKQYVKEENYIYTEPAICVEIVRQALNGEYHDVQLNNLEEALYRDKQNINTQNDHVPKWNSLLRYIYQIDKIEKKKESAKLYYHIQQGVKRNDNLFVDTKRLSQAVQKVREKKLELDVTEDLNKVEFSQLKSVYEIYSDVMKRVTVVAEEEYDQSRGYIESIEKCFGQSDIIIEDLEDIQEDLNDVVELANATLINVNPIDTTEMMRKKNEIISAVKTLNKVSDDSSCIEKLLLFSDDPMGKLKELLQFITSLEQYLNRLDTKLTAKESEISDNQSSYSCSDFTTELGNIEHALDVLGGL